MAGSPMRTSLEGQLLPRSDEQPERIPPIGNSRDKPWTAVTSRVPDGVPRLDHPRDQKHLSPTYSTLTERAPRFVYWPFELIRHPYSQPLWTHQPPFAKTIYAIVETQRNTKLHLSNLKQPSADWLIRRSNDILCMVYSGCWCQSPCWTVDMDLYGLRARVFSTSGPN